MQSDFFTGTLPKLLSIVEVDRDDRVVCQSEGCGHSVFKRIHVVQVDGSIKVFGSECFKRLYGYLGDQVAIPAYGSSNGRLLTAQERQMLLENTEKFIAAMEAEHQAALLLEEQRKQAQHEAEEQARQKIKRVIQIEPPQHAMRVNHVINSPLKQYSGEKWDLARMQARQSIQATNPGVDLNSAGWSGLVLVEARRIFRELAKD